MSQQVASKKSGKKSPTKTKKKGTPKAKKSTKKSTAKKPTRRQSSGTVLQASQAGFGGEREVLPRIGGIRGERRPGGKEEGTTREFFRSDRSC